MTVPVSTVPPKRTQPDLPKSLMTPPLPPETPAKQRLLNAAMDLFHAQGVSATSPKQIMAASNTGQSQFYHYFGSKAGLVEAVLERYSMGIRQGLGPLDHRIQSWEQLTHWFESYIGAMEAFGMTRGCPLAAIARDTLGDTRLGPAAAEPFVLVAGHLATFFESEIAAGRLAAEDGGGLADWCLATLQGAVFLGQVHRDTKPLRAAFDHALAYIETLRR